MQPKHDQKTASKKTTTTKTTKARSAFKNDSVATVADNLQCLVRIIHEGMALLPDSDSVPTFLADATVIIGDAMLDLAALDKQLEARTTAGGATSATVDGRRAAEKFQELIRDQRHTLQWAMLNLANYTDGDVEGHDVNSLRSQLLELMKSSLSLEDFVSLVADSAARRAA